MSVPLSLPEDLVEILLQHDASPDDLDVAEPSFALERQLKDRADLAPHQRKAVFAEVAALQMDLLSGQERSQWGTRFRPIFERITDDGQRHCFPDISQIEDAIISYLEGRCRESRHPALKARYADFLWDITKAATGQQPSIELARQAIDSYTECGRRFPNSHETEERLARALEIAISVRDSVRRDQVIDAMLALLTGEFPGTQAIWLFDVLSNQRGVTLSGRQQQLLVQSLEDELQRICTSEKPVGIVAKEPALRLAQHYQRSGNPDDVKRVIRTYGQALSDFAMSADGLVAMSWLQDAYATYVQFGMKGEAEALQIAAKGKGREAEGQMVRHSFSFEIPADKVEAALEELTADDLESTLERISINFCPRIEDLERQLDDIKANAKLLSMVPQSLLANQQVIGRAGSIDSDREGRLLIQMSQHVQFSASLLAAAIDRARAKYEISAQTMSQFLSQSPLFDQSRIPFFEHAIESYLRDDHIAAAHVLVPQIEASLRSLLVVLAKPTNKHRREDRSVMVEKSMNDVLEFEPAVQQFLGDDFTLYLRMFLCDPRGYNVRNNLAHGLMEPKKLHRGISDRLLHIVWSLAFVR